MVKARLSFRLVLCCAVLYCFVLHSTLFCPTLLLATLLYSALLYPTLLHYVCCVWYTVFGILYLVPGIL